MIEARELTIGYTQQEVEPHRTIEADDANDAIVRYVREKEAELVSVTRPSHSSESIATVRKEDSVYLLRVYSA